MQKFHILNPSYHYTFAMSKGTKDTMYNNLKKYDYDEFKKYFQ